MRSTRILGPVFALALALPLSAPLAAQMHHVDQPQRVTRAVGVYEWTGDIKKPDAARLIPVSLFTAGQFQDAGVFLAEPIPLALETGTVYALQHSGNPIGTIDLDFARNVVDRRSVSDDNPIGAWYGYGRFLPLTAEKQPKLTEYSGHPAVVVSSDPDNNQPHFINRTPGENGNPVPSAGTTTASANTPAPPNDPDRPTLTRRDDAGTSSGASSTDNAPSSPGTADIDDDPDRPTLGHRDAPAEGKKKKSKDSGSYVEPMATSLNDDPNRPDLHAGKVESPTAPPQLTGLPANLHQAVAVSDAANNPTHVFARDWGSPTERASTLADMQQLAQPLARRYLAANDLQPAPAASGGPKLVTTAAKTPTKSRTAHRGSNKSAAPAPLDFTEEQLAGYTLSYGGLPTFVYSAQVPTASDAIVYVTVVAQRLPSGQLQTSLTSVTDSTHLDRVPWMRLIDAVDPDDSHRASLLFELRARSSRQFALYSLASAQAQQSFVTGIIE
ncbi:MAG TPA: hypothetical protein VMD97_09795 [Candidatus Aquilonibacter sp.]|nr:hypothetical protein [Candidatus Aquilonibacter sp.]